MDFCCRMPRISPLICCCCCYSLTKHLTRLFYILNISYGKVNLRNESIQVRKVALLIRATTNQLKSRMLPRWVYWGLFLESLEKFSGPKSQLSNYNPLVLKSWCLNITFLKDCEVWWLRTSALRRYKGNRGTRNRPEKIPDSWETGAWWERKTAKHRENSGSEVEKSESNDHTGERCRMLCRER